MANNRIILTHSPTGTAFVLFKRFTTEYYTPDHDMAAYATRLNAWLKECFEADPGKPDSFELRYQSPRENRDE